MKKIIGIIVAIALFIASIATNVYYMFDDDTTTTASVSDVVNKGQDVYKAFTNSDATSKSDAGATSTSE